MPSRFRCCILFCKAHSQSSYLSGICLHRFPSNQKKRQRWCREIKEKGHQIIKSKQYKSARICSQHFRLDDYAVPKDPCKEQPGILNSNAVPSIFPLPHSLNRNIEQQETIHSSNSSGNEEEFLTEAVESHEFIYQCQECGFSTRNFYEYSVHKIIHGDSGNTTEELMSDNENLNSGSSSKIMSSTQTVDLSPLPSLANENAKEEVFQCLYCSFCAHAISRFHEHMLGHSNDELFKCSHCDYKAADRNSVQQHIASKHPETTAKWVLVQEAIPGQHDKFLKRKSFSVISENITVEEEPEEAVKSDVAMVVKDGTKSMPYDNSSTQVSLCEDPLSEMNISDGEVHQIFLVEPSAAKELKDNINGDLNEPEISLKIQMQQLESEMKAMSDELNYLLFKDKQAIQTCTHLQQNVNSVKLNLDSLQKKFKNVALELEEKERQKVDICSQLSQKIVAKTETEITLRLNQWEVLNAQISLLQETNSEQHASLTHFKESVESCQAVLLEQNVEIEELQQKKQHLEYKIEKMEKSRVDAAQLLATLSAQMSSIESNIQNCDNLNVLRTKIKSLRIRQNGAVQSFISVEKDLMKLKYLKMMKKLEKKKNHWLNSLKLKGPPSGNVEAIENI